jgi:hypothetical protein
MDIKTKGIGIDILSGEFKLCKRKHEKRYRKNVNKSIAIQ